MLLHAALTLLITYALKKIVYLWRALRGIDNVPGYRTLLSSDSILGTLIPRLPGICPGRNHLFSDKYSVFEWAGCDITSEVGLFPTRADLSIADAGAIKEITSSRARFLKPVESYTALLIYGQNIVASEGEEWKKYRKIAAPAFSDRNNKLVWDETVAIMDDLFQNVWGDKSVISVDHCADITLSITLFVISGTGFGRKMTWEGDLVIPKGHKMTFKDALQTVAGNVIYKLALSDRLMSLSKKTREIALAFTELKQYMTEMIDHRLNSEKVERYDLFSCLLDTNNEEFDQGGQLPINELISNVFIFLLAGHETTGHALCLSFALLALHPDEQEKLYQHVKKVIPNRHIPTYEEIPLLTYTMAVFYETLRMFPPVPVIPKISAEDTSLTTTDAQGVTRVVPVPAGTHISLFTSGLHYNPKYWEDPHSFKPERFLKPDWNRDAFLPFGGGARACLGRKFAETEITVVLTMLVSRYKITVKEEPQFAHEAFEQRKERLLKTKVMLTLTPIRVPLEFTRRV